MEMLAVHRLLGVDFLGSGILFYRRGCLTTIGRLNTVSLICSETRGMDAYLRYQKKDADKRQPTRNAGEPEPSPPGHQLDDVAVSEDSSAQVLSVDTIF